MDAPFPHVLKFIALIVNSLLNYFPYTDVFTIIILLDFYNIHWSFININS